MEFLTGGLNMGLAGPQVKAGAPAGEQPVTDPKAEAQSLYQQTMHRKEDAQDILNGLNVAGYTEVAREYLALMQQNQRIEAPGAFEAAKTQAQGTMGLKEVPANNKVSSQPQETESPAPVEAGPFQITAHTELMTIAEHIGLGKDNWKQAGKLLADIGGFSLNELYLKPKNEIWRLFKELISSQAGARESI